MITRPATKTMVKLPNHLAIVPDGNGRWAERRGLSRLHGHRAGAENMRRMVEYLNEHPIEYITLYLFSTENWHRPEEEVRGIFELAAEVIDRNTLPFHKKEIRLRHLGRLHELPANLQTVINKAVELTKDNTGTTLNLAFNYGGRAEILDAVRRIINDGIPAQNIDEELFGNYLYTIGLPNVDLLIRTGDELRLSNYLIWQTAYSEYYFTKVLWPAFGKKDMDKALLSYNRRQRRFGGL